MKNIRLNPLLVGTLLGFGLLLLLVLVPGRGWAPQMIRVGVVNWSRVVTSYESFQSEISELEEQRSNWLVILEEPRADEDDAGEMYREALEQIESRRDRVIRDAHREIYEAIEEVAITNGYSLVLSENEVLYASEAYTDLTNQVVQRLN